MGANRSINKSMEKLKFDVRMVDINLKAQILTKSDLDGHLKSLSDVGSHAEPFDLDESSSTDEDSSSL